MRAAQPRGLEVPKMSTKLRLRLSLILALILTGATEMYGNSVPPPFTNDQPFNTDCLGQCSGNFLGSFRINGGPPTIRWFIGSGAILRLNFAVPFTVGPGNDFAIVTSSEAWTAPADNTALFRFFFGAKLVASFTSSLAPDQLLQFDLPMGLVANRVTVTNLTSGVMTFDDAGAANRVSQVPEPSTLLTLGTGLLGLFGAARRKLRS
jgi:PEP-CTERM motif-containing protein